ncbi:hypothetical protein ACIXGC_19415 [Bacteroides fragilis]
MARIRTIKPEFWEDEKIGKLPIPCRLFFIGCWNFADDFGVIKGNAALLKSQIFPYDENLRVSEIKKVDRCLSGCPDVSTYYSRRRKLLLYPHIP